MCCVGFDCDACCRYRVWADGRRAYWVGAEGADWVADAESWGYVIDAAAAAFAVCFVIFWEGVIDFDVGAIESMGVL